MGFFSKWRQKRKDKKAEKSENVKQPSSSYEIYNSNETQILEPVNDKKVSVGYDEDENIKVTNTSLDVEKKANRKSSGKTQTISKDAKNKRNIYYVSVRKDKEGRKLGWEVKKENAERVTRICETKEQAIDFVKEKAGNQGSTCIIRKVDGSIDKTMKFDSK